MALEYAIPEHGTSLTDTELKEFSEKNGYRLDRVGNHENGGMMIVLRDGDCVGMTFLLVDKSNSNFMRVY